MFEALSYEFVYCFMIDNYLSYLLLSSATISWNIGCLGYAYSLYGWLWSHLKILQPPDEITMKTPQTNHTLHTMVSEYKDKKEEKYNPFLE